ncbi:uncharacterized protein LOC133730205 [Rosa rugosa]|uniref:uncharacterized protein LOC133730205 n=1 Tax=Rosa rugosa TaxID=74645 RepID=UPI002B40EFDA|nr:uncharacterized protein LOC133730205 [Rosa rugosa]
MSALCTRRIVNTPLCTRCQQANETPLHATYWCPSSVAVLEKVSFFSKLGHGAWGSFVDDEVCFLIVLLWLNWKERNAVQHGEQVKPTMVIYEMGLSIWESIKHARGRNHEGQVDDCIIAGNDVHWAPPPGGSLKLNYDASVAANGEQVGIGSVCRDSDGNMVAAMGERVAGRLKPCAAELFSVMRGVEWAMERGWTGLVVETDCLEAVRMVNGSDECLASEGTIVERIREILGALDIHNIQYVPREANMAAHAVAGVVARGNGRSSWLGVGPSWLMDVIGNDGPVTGYFYREESGEFLSTTGHSHVL